MAMEIGRPHISGRDSGHFPVELLCMHVPGVNRVLQNGPSSSSNSSNKWSALPPFNSPYLKMFFQLAPCDIGVYYNSDLVIVVTYHFEGVFLPSHQT